VATRDRPDFLVHRPGDAVGVVIADVPASASLRGSILATDELVELTAKQPIPFGHKVAIRALEAGEEVVEYGSVIGRASAAIRAGDHVHVHNLRSIRWPGAAARTRG
jgi:(2R)-sulfolactate sulfo-lyase subunit alpha